VPSSDQFPDGSPPSPERVAELVNTLAIVMRDADVTELDVSLGTLSVRLRRSTAREGDVVASPPQTQADEPFAAHAVGYVVTAPMVGTFYSAPTPSAPPFVSAGDRVITGQTIGIIEAMKIMNEIAADRSGIVQELLVSNGQPVEYGSPLVRLSEDGRL
jgi:acetyl-CoA carboxylase biotin carboxyl carrier protein